SYLPGATTLPERWRPPCPDKSGQRDGGCQSVVNPAQDVYLQRAWQRTSSRAPPLLLAGWMPSPLRRQAGGHRQNSESGCIPWLHLFDSRHADLIRNDREFRMDKVAKCVGMMFDTQRLIRHVCFFFVR